MSGGRDPPVQLRLRALHEGGYGCALHLLLTDLHGDDVDCVSGGRDPPVQLRLRALHDDGGGHAIGAYEPSAILHLQSFHPLGDGCVGDHDDSHSRRDLYHRYNELKEREETGRE